VRNHLTKQSITISVFKTNIEAKDIIILSSIFNKIPSIQKWNTDLEDFENILRIEMKMNKLIKFWDNASKNYDKTEERFDYIHNKSRENTKKHLYSSNIVLDYGCGTGTTTCEVANLVKEIHAIDISPKMIEIAKEKANARQIENVNFIATGIFDTRLKKKSFDTILAFNVLHTIPNPDGVMKRIDELLKPDGIFISITPCLRDKMSLLVRNRYFNKK